MMLHYSGLLVACIFYRSVYQLLVNVGFKADDLYTKHAGAIAVHSLPHLDSEQFRAIRCTFFKKGKRVAAVVKRGEMWYPRRFTNRGDESARSTEPESSLSSGESDE
jgi:hypothetical protein